jgi:hypothetical protein
LKEHSLFCEETFTLLLRHDDRLMAAAFHGPDAKPLMPGEMRTVAPAKCCSR